MCFKTRRPLSHHLSHHLSSTLASALGEREREAPLALSLCLSVSSVSLSLSFSQSLTLSFYPYATSGSAGPPAPGQQVAARQGSCWPLQNIYYGIEDPPGAAARRFPLSSLSLSPFKGSPFSGGGGEGKKTVTVTR